MTLTPPSGEDTEAQVEVIDQATIKELEEALRDWDKPSSEGRKMYEESRSEWEQALDPLVDAALASERLTEADFAIRINTISPAAARRKAASPSRPAPCTARP